MKTSLNVIRAEHRALAAIIHGLHYLVEQIRKGGPKPDFKVFRAMVYYIDTFPEKLHHPKEDRYLFRMLHERTQEANSVLESLEAQHIRGAALIRELEQALLRWEAGGDAFFPEFVRQVEHYSDFHWKHMREEEDFVLPLAERVLTAEDWKEIDAAFAGNADPLVGNDLQKDFNKLFSQIVSLAPPPIGVGPEPAG
jgi:hemerythrin-like domain-containing protein